MAYLSTMEKTRVTMTADGEMGDYREGDCGYIDGYVRGGNDAPYAAVVFDSGHITLVKIRHLTALFTNIP